jgi:hypothetical protein
MQNPEIMYNSAGMPVGTRTVQIYRWTGGSGAPAYPLAAGGNVILLGTYNLEMFGWKDGAKEIERMKPSGADLDFALLRQKITGSATAQLATGVTPLLRGGIDCFEVSPGYESDGATPLPAQRFVIIDASKDENEGAAQKQSLTLRFDRNNSDPYWQS